ncbi:hypothetical protein GAGA_4068 [Paraglaciecola agarilytica NO2]|uniref:Uncharacterized protein n=1 Tax=Paraglaciecola agarilytica NO2 TaxID=1125747 RepID=A0ABQ0IBV9_9ALTE|nr:hypothetical protein GAGA_4068 [Paraglaciecola agarilytica NO2]
MKHRAHSALFVCLWHNKLPNVVIKYVTPNKNLFTKSLAQIKSLKVAGLLV